MKQLFCLILWIMVLVAMSIPESRAGEADVLARVVYQEAGGESVRAAALTACSAVNRAKKTRGGVAGLVRKGVVKAKVVPLALRPYFLAIARTALSARGKGGVCRGADSWNRGRKPRWAGKVKGYAGRQVYYAMNEVEK
jgi:hypothetical protein